MPAARTRRIVHQRAKGPIDPALGQRVKTLRMAKGISQAQLAEPDFSKGFISLIETGRSRLSLRAAEIVARKLGVTVTELIGLTVSTDAHQFDLHLQRAEHELALGRPEPAFELAGAALARAQGPWRARLLRLRGRALLDLGRAREAVTALDEAARIFRTANDREATIRTTFDLALAHARLDAIADAVHLALDVEYRLSDGELVDRTLELKVMNFLAGMFVRTGDHVGADLRAARALELAQDVSDPTALATLYMGLSLTRQEQGDLEAALLYSRKALGLFEELRREREVAETWNNLGWLYVQRQQFGKAEEALTRSQRLAEQATHPGLEAMILATRAELALARGKHSDALELAERAIAHPAARPFTKAGAIWIRALIFAAQKAPLAKLRAAFDVALEAHESEPARVQARVHESYAKALIERGQAAEAASHYQRALDLSRGRS